MRGTFSEHISGQENLSQDNYIRNSQFQKSVRRHVSERHEI